MKITILSCGPGLEDIVSQYGHSSEWIPSIINNPTIDYNIKNVYLDNNFSLDKCDGYIITGSKYSVYDSLDWIKNLKDYVKCIISNNFSILGICFGHQLIAECLGGTVRKNQLGWELGSYPIYLTEDGLGSPLFRDIDKQPIVYQSHKDCVLELPKQAVQLAYNQKCTQAFQIDGSIYSVQFHPEFSWNVMKKYVSVRNSSGVIVDDPSIPKSTQGHLVLRNFINLI